MVLPGDLGFMTGLTAGRREASQVAADWKQYAQGLNNQIASLAQQLHRERTLRSTNRADVAGMTLAINALPPEIREIVKKSIAQYYASGFIHRAVELGLPHESAVQVAEEWKNTTLQTLSQGR